jgi:hypothetical protein
VTTLLSQQIYKNGLAKPVIAAGGSVHPLIIPADLSGTGLMNPSIYIDGQTILVNLRHVNYTLWHSEHKKFEHRYGPLQYLHPENDIHLRTWNYMCVLNPDLTIRQVTKVDTSECDKEPIWEFVGLEDARLVRWDHKLWLTGVRRDTTTHGEGRMELSEINMFLDQVKEITRKRIPALGDNTSYCEKNWMPVLDQPFTYVKWTNPTEVVKYDINTGQTHTIVAATGPRIPGVPDFRGGSQVIPYGDNYIALVHETNLFNSPAGKKDATYRHRFVMWDRSWKLLAYTDAFSFMNADIEFCCGAAWYDNHLLVTFGFQDNCAFVLKIPKTCVDEFIQQANYTTPSIPAPTVVEPVKQKWQKYPAPTLEITTIIPEKGCVVDCVFCPQRTLEEVYKGTRILTLDAFKTIVDKVPTDVRITFAGFTEPWMNKYCTEMVVYAHEQGHPVSVFTTGVGVSVEDMEAIVDIPFAGNPNGGFVLHLPDAEMLARHPITPGYLKTLEWIRDNQHRIKNFSVMSMGKELHPSIRHIFDWAPSYEMWSRAGNLIRESVAKPQLITLRDRWNAITHTGPKTCGCVEGLYHNVLLPNGDVSLCCMDYGLEHIIGNLNTQTYEDVIPEDQTCYELCNFCENATDPKEKTITFHR